MLEINKIHQGDSAILLKQIEDNSIDLTATSPPYDNLRNYKGYSFDFETIAKELYRVTKEGGVVIWVVGDATINGSESTTSFKQAIFFTEVGFNLHDTMIYKRRGIPLNHNRYEQHFEYMFVFSKGKPKTFNPILQKNKIRKSSPNEGYHNQSDGSKKKISAKRKEYSIIGNVFEYNVGFMNSSKDKITFQHPATFPEQLAKDHILSWSNQGDLILDPFVGSGTTCKMAKSNRRRFIGVDISKEYIKIANKRLQQNTLNEVKPNSSHQ